MSEIVKEVWRTIRNKNIEELQVKYDDIKVYDTYCRDIIKNGNYRISPPLIKPSKLASKEKGGVGKDLSEGWGLNFSIGCAHGCIFCYANQIHKRRLGKLLSGIPWGKYLFVPENFDEAIAKTPWKKWEGKEVLMSATHDPYLPQLYGYARKILETALPHGVRFCIQTRSPYVLRDLDILENYKDQIRIQVSIATFNSRLYKTIEPCVVSPRDRLKIIEEFKERNIKTGVIIAPIFPPNELRPDFLEDLTGIFETLTEVRPDHVFGEILHMRGSNMRLIETSLGEKFSKAKLNEFDEIAGKTFKKLVSKYDLEGDWWPEYKKCI